MKNQNDWICIGACSLVALIVSLVLFFTKREPVSPAPPTPVVLTPPTYPAGAVTYAAGLSGGSNASGGFGGMGGGSMGGPPMGGGGGGRPGVQSAGGGGAPGGGSGRNRLGR